MGIPSFSAAQGNLKYSTTAVVFDADTDFGSETWGSAVISCKSITVSPPKGETEVLQLLGQETVSVGSAVPASGTFQNVVMDEKAWTEGKLTCTLVLTGDETNVPDFLNLATGEGATVSTNTYNRHTFGDSTTNHKRNPNGAIILELENGSENFYVVLNNAFVKWGDIKPTGMDGHFEVDIEANCFPKNFVIDMKK